MSYNKLHKKRNFFHSNYFNVGAILLLFVIAWWQELLHLPSINFTGGDGGKNQFAFIDYVLYGKGLMTYGMNYPFGEHITFTDGEPPLVIMVKFVHDYIISLDDYVLSIHNLWVLLQIPLGAIAFYYVLINIINWRWLALIGAIFILAMSPQLMRLHTHFSLGYIFVYGVIFNCLWHITSDIDKVKFSIYLFLIAFFGGFSHLYNLLGLLIFTGFLILFGLITRQVKWKHLLYILLPIGIATVVIIILIQGLDPFPLRPQTAEGLFNYSATFEGTFYPLFGAEGAWFKSLFPDIHISNWEGRNFLGFAAIVANLIFIIKYIIKKGKKKTDNLLMLFWLSSLGVFLYASEVFFVPFDKEFILSLPYISQFRSIGRFAVIFYYMVGVLGIYSVMSLLQSSKKWIKAIAILLLLLWGTEAYYNHAALKSDRQITLKGALFEKPVFNMDSVLVSYNRKIEDYQCALILPVASGCNFGSEYVGSYFTVHYGARLRLESGLPQLGSVYTRGAINHGIGLSQLLSTYPTKKILLPYLNNKKILLVYPESEKELTAGDKRLIAAGTYIGRANSCMLSEVVKEDFKKIQIANTSENELLESNAQLTITKKVLGDSYSLATFKREDTTKGLNIKLKTSIAPNDRIAKYSIDFLDEKGLKIWEVPMPFNDYDFEGSYNVRQVIFTRRNLWGVTSIRLMTNLKNERNKELSIYSF